MSRKRIFISPLFFLSIAAGLLIVPVRWLIAWLLATVVHELFHLITMMILRVPIYEIQISISGVRIQTGYMSWWKELICTLAGPLGAFALMLFSRYFPYMAICATIQSVFNLLPIYPFDGGRAIKCVTEKLIGEYYALKVLLIVKAITLVLFVVFSVWLALYTDIGVFSIILCSLLLIRTNIINRPCKLPVQYSTIKQIM